MSRAILSFFLVICLAAYPSGGQLVAQDQKGPGEGKKTRFAAVLPLSGETAAVGAAFRNGIVMGLEKLPPDVRSQVEVVYEDDGFSSRQAVTAFNKLMVTGGIDALINAGSGTGHALAPLAEQHRVAFLAVASDPTISAGRRYVFNFWVTPEEESRVMLAEALRRGYRKIARVSTQHEGPLSIARLFDQINAGRLEVVLDEAFLPDAKDFKTFVARLRSYKDVDAVMVLLLPGQCGVFAKQLRQSGLRQELFAVEVFEDPNEVQASNGALIGSWYVNADEPDDSFVREYERRFPGASRWGALNAHDAVLLVGAAVQEGYKGKRIAEYVRALKDFSGALGTYSVTADNRFTLPATVKIVTATGFEKAGE